MDISFRRVKESDVADIFEYGSDEEVIKWVTFDKHDSLEDSYKSYLFLSNQDDDIFVITADKKMIGTVSIQKIKSDSIDLGIVINRKYWGNGIGKKAINFILKFASNYYSGRSIGINILENNERSIALFEKMDFKETRQEGNLKYFSYSPKN